MMTAIGLFSIADAEPKLNGFGALEATGGYELAVGFAFASLEVSICKDGDELVSLTGKATKLKEFGATPLTGGADGTRGFVSFLGVTLPEVASLKEKGFGGFDEVGGYAVELGAFACVLSVAIPSLAELKENGSGAFDDLGGYDEFAARVCVLKIVESDALASSACGRSDSIGACDFAFAKPDCNASPSFAPVVGFPLNVNGMGDIEDIGECEVVGAPWGFGLTDISSAAGVVSFVGGEPKPTVGLGFEDFASLRGLAALL